MTRQFSIRQITFAMLAGAGLAWAAPSELLLKDGTKVRGDVVLQDDTYVLTTPTGSRNIPRSDVVSLKLVSSANSSDDTQGNARLESLRRAVQALDDIDTIIDRYQQFIGQYKDTETATAAQADLEEWKQRKQQGMVRFGGQWMTEDERANAARGRLQTVLEIRRLVEQKDMQGARGAVNAALAADPEDVSAVYLDGVLQYEAGNLADARKAFETVSDKLGTPHAPTLNNLAVINFAQNRVPAALKYYRDAIDAAPAARIILDNTAEALHASAAANINAAVRTPLEAKFNTADAVLQRTMGQQNLHRWGSVWVDDTQWQQIAAARAQNDQKIKALQNDFDVTTQQIEQVKAQIARQERLLSDLRAQSIYRNQDGTIVRRPLPQSYYDAERDLINTKAELADKELRINALRAEALRTRDGGPEPLFTGNQQIIGIDGVPIEVPPGMSVDVQP